MSLTNVECLEIQWAAGYAMEYEEEEDPLWGVDDAAEGGDVVADRELREMEQKLDEIEKLAGVLRGLEKEVMELPEVVPRMGSCLSEETVEYVVVAILGKKSSASNGKQYLCLWSSDGGLSWECEDDIDSVNLIERYEATRKRKWEEVLKTQHLVSRKKFAQRTASRGWTYKPMKPKKTPPPTPGGGGGGASAPSTEYDRLMHLDVPALRVYLQTVTEFTPLHYDLLLRLSEEDVSRGCTQTALKRLRPATSEEAATSDTCPVCFDDFDAGTPPTILPCGHLFHTDCIMSWLGNEKTCPMCKAEV